LPGLVSHGGDGLCITLCNFDVNSLGVKHTRRQRP
jgi:hypothetical protein